MLSLLSVVDNPMQDIPLAAVLRSPIVGMTDRIVDITATGTTLRENDLVITGEIMECTARFFANPGRARLDARLHALAKRLEAVRPL